MPSWPGALLGFKEISQNSIGKLRKAYVKYEIDHLINKVEKCDIKSSAVKLPFIVYVLDFIELDNFHQLLSN